MHDALFWLLITLLCILTQGFYSMLEMASVSFNRVRLEYYVNKGIKRAIWLQKLLQKPSRLFGTVMLGVNIALQVGSQSSREFYKALNLDPDIAAITQIFFVVIIAELAPLFAAYRYAEHVIMLGMPIVYGTYRLLAPLIWFIGLLSKGVAKLVGSTKESLDPLLTREELQKILESHEEGFVEGEEFNYVVANIFSLKNKKASHVMVPIEKIDSIPSNATIFQLRQKIGQSAASFVPIYHKTKFNVVALAFPKDLVRLGDNKIVRDYARSPWFITMTTPLIQILKQFRSNNQSVAVVLDANGFATGILSLAAILEEIFGQWGLPEMKKPMQTIVIERSFPGNTKIADFNGEYGANIDSRGAETLAQLMITVLERLPEKDESLVIGPFEFTAEETTLLGIKTIHVKTLES